jgi:hypothetical protein
MRTTVDIADDVLLAAKEFARREKSSIGAVLSDLARQSLLGRSAAPSSAAATAGRLAALGIQPLPRRGSAIVSNELIDRIRDEEGI